MTVACGKDRKFAGKIARGYSSQKQTDLKDSSGVEARRHILCARDKHNRGVPAVDIAASWTTACVCRPRAQHLGIVAVSNINCDPAHSNRFPSLQCLITPATAEFGWHAIYRKLVLSGHSVDNSPNLLWPGPSWSFSNNLLGQSGVILSVLSPVVWFVSGPTGKSESRICVGLRINGPNHGLQREEELKI
ncbi:unnamed protein product [Hermetia illucens]|uniref:Uncharacterized protein n=1 Tax=Hermetia illucens TaxID=343691 RepID=A0A7R8YKU6_HERIL|nr:unnamed protein product [Hermetia illucens]